jgi:hypothetical protein
MVVPMTKFLRCVLRGGHGCEQEALAQPAPTETPKTVEDTNDDSAGNSSAWLWVGGGVLVALFFVGCCLSPLCRKQAATHEERLLPAERASRQHDNSDSDGSPWSSTAGPQY